jgi:hypothetical protein
LELGLYTVGRTPWTGDRSVARPLPTHRITDGSSGIRTHDPSVRTGEDGSCHGPRRHCSRRVRYVSLENYIICCSRLLVSEIGIVPLCLLFIELNRDVACPITDVGRRSVSGVAAPEVGGLAPSKEVYSDCQCEADYELRTKRGADFVSLFLGWEANSKQKCY